MDRFTLLTPFYSDAATLSGGSWAMDLALLQDPQPSRTVQSTDATNASTKLKIHFPTARAISGFAFGKTNLQADARVKFSGATSEVDLGSSGFVGGWGSVWPVTGRPTDADLEDFDVFKMITPGSAYEWWQAEFDDDTNTDGFVEFGRLYADEAWSPACNFTYGSEPTHVDTSIRNKTEGGFTNFEKRNGPRFWDLKFDFLSNAEAKGFIYELRRRIGTAGDVFVCLNPEETTYLHREMMMATFDAMPGTPYRILDRFNSNFKLLELR